MRGQGFAGGRTWAIAGLGVRLRAAAFTGGEWYARALAPRQGKSREVGGEVGRMGAGGSKG
jgi:hypothetical protein